MKRKLPLLLSLVGCALGVAAGDAAAQAKYNLRWGHYLADSPFVQLEKDFANEIEKRTNGQVKITITFAQGLGKTTEPISANDRYELEMTFSRGLTSGWLGGTNHPYLTHGRFGKKRGPLLGTIAACGGTWIELTDRTGVPLKPEPLMTKLPV